MANYLYNGVELPALPTWDKTTYPYAVIVEKYKTQGLPPNLVKITWYELYICDKEIQAISDNVCGAFDTSYTKSQCTDGVWGDFAEPQHSDSLGLSDVIWTYKTIYRSDGTIWLAASDPIPVTTAPAPDAASMLMGRLVGRAIAGQRGKKAEPSELIAYLYNGVQLPKLPEWDKETYPYAYISREVEWVGDSHYRVLYMTRNPLTINENEEVQMPDGNATCLIYAPYTTWGAVNESTWSTNGFAPVWTNTDILYEDGSVAIAASEPVPVYA